MPKKVDNSEYVLPPVDEAMPQKMRMEGECQTAGGPGSGIVGHKTVKPGLNANILHKGQWKKAQYNVDRGYWEVKEGDKVEIISSFDKDLQDVKKIEND